jgi:hypothetical protein
MGYLYYVDLKSAYWQIYRKLTLDQAWPRGQGQMPLLPVANALNAWKPARNAVVGITRSYQSVMEMGGKISYRPLKNPYLNPAIWRTIQSVLHELAEAACQMGAVYVATDGYIFREEKGADNFLQLLRNNGLFFRAKEGNGWINGWGRYRVGDKKTALADQEVYTQPLDNILRGEHSLQWWSML